jgi:peptide deformylase
VESDLKNLTIVHYPDPRLKRPAESVRMFDDHLAGLAQRMLELMRHAKGVGLAAPQVGLSVRIFVMNATGEPGDEQVYVNPEIHDPQGAREAEEGCLSIPEVNVTVRRAVRCRLIAQDLQGRRVEVEGQDLVARIWQHETDHLNGMLIIDRMGPGDRIATRNILRDLEAKFKKSGGR